MLVTMPNLGESVTEATLRRWLKNPGDSVERFEAIVEVATDKVNAEVPSPVDGVMGRWLAEEGQTLVVGAPICEITVAQEGAATETPQPSQPEPEPAASVPATALQGAQPLDLGEADGRPRSSPYVRRLAKEAGVDLRGVAGSGPFGRVTRADLQMHLEQRRVPTAPPAAVMPHAQSSQAPADVRIFPGDERIPLTPMRRAIAEHMVRSKQTSAHTMVAVEIDYSGVEKVRKAQRERFKAAEGFSLTYLPFIARAVVDALQEWPYLNSSVGDDELIVHREVNLGIAVDLDYEGLLVPVVHRAEEKRLVGVAREIASLASRARGKRLTMDDISGGTITLTNAGGFGTLITVPVINQPQVAILSTDGVKKRPVAVLLPDGSDGIAVHPMGNLVMSWDHRAVDGAYAAAFMARVREILETRDWSAEL